MLSAQIQALREHRDWTQEQLGTAAEGMKQTQVSRLENPDYSGGTIKSLKRLANAFDLGLIVRFVKFSEFLDE
jgi:transcriptional regulator with XRE-family HTH domain